MGWGGLSPLVVNDGDGSFVMVSFGFTVGFLVCSSCWGSTDEGVRSEVLCVDRIALRLATATNRPQKLTFNVQPVTALASENAGVLAPRAPSAFAFLDLTPCYEPAGTEVQHVTVLAPRPLHTLLSTRVKTWSCSTSVKRVSGPAYSEDIRDVFGRREPWFAVCQIQIWAVTGDISPSAATYNDILFQ